jgi:Asp-tRNA(Asn)/Glu-tRNA(Gln) amidotransferase A subunit family amidase
VGDPYWAPPPARPFLDEVGVDPGRLRIAVCTEPWNGSSVDAECKEAVAAAAKLCANLGHVVDEARPEIDVRGLMEAQRMIVSSSTRMVLEMRAGFFGREPKPEDVEKYTWRVATYGSQVRAVDYARSMIAIHRAGRSVARFFTSWDVLLTPTMCRPPYRLKELDTMSDDVEAFTKVLWSVIAFASLFNASGSPAMSVPLHWSRDGLPVGVQFVSGFGEEARLLRLAAQLETVQPWAEHRPPRLQPLRSQPSASG